MVDCYRIRRQHYSTTRSFLPRATRIALACACAFASTTPAWADFVSSGAVTMLPNFQPVPSGAGNADLPTVGLEVGAGSAGSFLANGGSTLQIGQFVLGTQNTSAHGALTLDGAGTKLTLSRLTGDGGSFIGYSGSGAVTVSGGATLDGRSQTGNCLASATMYCNTFVGTALGSSGTLTVTGAGSNAGFLRYFIVGGIQPFGIGPAVTSYVKVLAGGSLTTDNAQVAAPGSTNFSQSFAEALVDGPGSIWRITGASIAGIQGVNDDPTPYLYVGYGPNTSGKVAVTNGGSLVFDNKTAALLLAANGQADLRVDGAGSSVRFTGIDSGLTVGRRALLAPATGTMAVRNGASVSGVGTFSVARDGSTGSLLIDGPGSSVRVDGLNSNGNAAMFVGRAEGGSGAKGAVTLDHGGALVVAANPSSVSATPAMLVIGRDTGTEGKLTASGGSSVSAAWVGVGRVLNGNGTSSNGGTGALVLNDSTLTANRLVVGSQGSVGGSGGRITATTFENHGLLNPGNSPGTLFIDANYVGAAGSRVVLEVASDGHGGYLTDALVFSAGRSVDLTLSAIEFRFLGTANPYTFKQAGEFDIDTFLKVDLGSGNFGELAEASYRGAVFTASSQTHAITGFSYSVDDHVASFATPVPEPSAWAMLVGGFALMLSLARRAVRRRSLLAA